MQIKLREIQNHTTSIDDEVLCILIMWPKLFHADMGFDETGAE